MYDLSSSSSLFHELLSILMCIIPKQVIHLERRLQNTPKDIDQKIKHIATSINKKKHKKARKQRVSA